MKQVEYGARLVPLFSKNDDGQSDVNDLEEKLVAQLSHSDGIRGFMVSYLTVDSADAPADWETIPEPLQKALAKANMDDLVPLASE